MKRTLTLVTLILLIALTGTVLAGEKHAKHAKAKCDQDVETCLNRLAAKIQEKAWLGVKMESAKGGYHRITHVVADSPAEAAGFQAGDVILALNGVALNGEHKAELKKAKMSLRPGKSSTYVVKRDGAKQKLAVTLSHVPAAVMAEWIGEHMLTNHAETVVAAMD